MTFQADDKDAPETAKYLANFIPDKKFLVLDSPYLSQVRAVLNYRVNGNGSCNLPPPSPPTADTTIDGAGTATLGDFDFAVINYSWTEQNGKDLDTRTRIVKPERNTDVGYARSEDDAGMLTWAGDNTANSGSESVLVNIPKIIQEYPSETDIRINLSAYWYSKVLNGDYVMEFTTYKGGEMTKQGTVWTNAGGERKQNVTVKANVMLQESANIDGELKAYLKFNTITKNGALYTL